MAARSNSTSSAYNNNNLSAVFTPRQAPRFEGLNGESITLPRLPLKTRTTRRHGGTPISAPKEEILNGRRTRKEPLIIHFNLIVVDSTKKYFLIMNIY